MRNSDDFDDIKLLKTQFHDDERGFFSEIFNKKNFKSFGIEENFLQDNLSFSKKRGTIRGLHFQNNPYAQSKLLRVIDGKIQDVFVDLRKNSKTFEISGSEVLGPDEGWIYIPKGFAHGFCTLTDDVRILYKVDSYYSSEMDMGIRWDDELFNIDWLIDKNTFIMSEKDRELPLWRDIKDKIDF